MFIYCRFGSGLLVFALLLFLQSYTALASNSTKNCHCFQNRMFNPSKTFSSDGYLLTTTTNSFISSWFDFDKRQIVFMKMRGGIGSDDLLIGLYLSSLTKEPIGTFMASRAQGKNWQTILSVPELTTAVKKNRILASLQDGVDPKNGARQITDSLLSRFYSIDPAQIKNLRKQNLTSKELTLLVTLSVKSGIKPELLVDFTKNQGLSYSEIAFNLGFQPNEIKTIIHEIKSKRSPGNQP